LAGFQYHVIIFGHASHGVLQLGNSTDSQLEYHYGDFANSLELEKVVDGADVVIHLVGNTVPQSSNDNPRFDVDAHIGPSLTLLDLCVKHKVGQVIFTSSGGTVYGVAGDQPIVENQLTMPISSYGIQKITIEHYLRLYQRLHGLNSTVLRVSNPYGPGQGIGRNQGLIAMVCHKILHNSPVEIWGDGSVVRDYIYVQDLVSAIEKSILHVSGFEVFNVGTGIGSSINHVLELFRDLGYGKFQVDYRPARAVDIPTNILDITKFSTQFSWRPQYLLSEGIRKTMQAISENQ